MGWKSEKNNLVSSFFLGGGREGWWEAPIKSITLHQVRVRSSFELIKMFLVTLSGN